MNYVHTTCVLCCMYINTTSILINCSPLVAIETCLDDMKKGFLHFWSEILSSKLDSNSWGILQTVFFPERLVCCMKADYSRILHFFVFWWFEHGRILKWCQCNKNSDRLLHTCTWNIVRPKNQMFLNASSLTRSKDIFSIIKLLSRWLQCVRVLYSKYCCG